MSQLYDYQRHWLSKEEADVLFQQGWNTWPWTQGAVHLFGRSIREPRRSFFQGDIGIQYTYAGRRLIGQGWMPELDHLKERINQEYGVSFNSVLVNGYRNGQDYMGYHQDNEVELGALPHIASISIGAERDFLLKSMVQPASVEKIFLHHGSMLFMYPEVQKSFKHALPKRLGCHSPRINLTFRQIL